MASYGMLRNYRFTDAAEDIRGSKLYGLNDEKLGKIDDVIFDHSTGLIRYVVVDTGGWLTTKRFIVPAERLRASAEHDKDFAVDLIKAQVEDLPPYKETDLESDEQWSDYENKYRSKWEANPVMHRKDTDRNITPTTQQMPGNSPSARPAGLPSASAGSSGIPSQTPSTTPDIEDTEFIRPGFAGGTSTVEIKNSAVGIGGRWDTFQDRLRERRKEVIGAGVKEKDEGTYRKRPGRLMSYGATAAVVAFPCTERSSVSWEGSSRDRRGRSICRRGTRPVKGGSQVRD